LACFDPDPSQDAAAIAAAGVQAPVRCPQSALGVVLVGNGRPEQGH
jgi:hypothetical protein